MQSQTRKIFIVSLDGATFSVLNPLVKQGVMPNLGDLMSRSAVAELESVIPPVTAPAWSSFMTGKYPHKHGILDFSRFNPESYNWTINNAENIQSKTLWQILSEKGKRVVVLNLPYTYPPYEVNGVLVSGWDAPFTDAAFSAPPEVSCDILRRFPDYKTNLWVSEFHPLRSEEQFEQFTDRLKMGFEQQTRIALDLLAQEPWDVFMVHFQQTDWIQHKLWSYIEQGCKDAADHKPRIDATRDCYRAFDEWVGRLIGEVEPLDPTIILLSDHGFGRLMGNIHPNFYLKQWGYLSVIPEAEDRFTGVKKAFRHSKYKTVRDLYHTIAKARNRTPKAGDTKRHSSWVDNAEDIMSGRGSAWDWSKTRAAMVYAYQTGFIYVNVRGRGPQGVVELGSEYETIIADLISRFQDIRHPQTGARLLQDVVRSTDLYPAAESSTFVPDLVLIPVDGYGFSFSVNAPLPQVSEEGTHRHNGVVSIRGDCVRAPLPDFRPDLVDLAPTILHILGLSIPSDMDGRVLEEVVSVDWPVRHEEVDNRARHATIGCTPQEAEIVAQRLRGLGYLA